MIGILDIRYSGEFQEIVEILKKDKKTKEYYAKLKLIEQTDTIEYNMLYIESLEYQENLIQGLKRKIKIQKLIKKL